MNGEFFSFYLLKSIILITQYYNKVKVRKKKQTKTKIRRSLAVRRKVMTVVMTLKRMMVVI